MQAFLEILKAALFGIVEGITEWLPISSTGHMILLNSTPLKLSVSDEFYSMFEVVIQLGAIMAVVITFWLFFWWRLVAHLRLPLAGSPSHLQVRCATRCYQEVTWR